MDTCAERELLGNCLDPLEGFFCHFCCILLSLSKPKPSTAVSFHRNKNPQTHPGSISFGANRVRQRGFKSLLEHDSKAQPPLCILWYPSHTASYEDRGMTMQMPLVPFFFKILLLASDLIFKKNCFLPPTTNCNICVHPF